MFITHHLPPWLWALVIFAASSVPLEVPPIAGAFTDKIGHFLEYAILGFLFVRSLRNFENVTMRRAAFILAFIASSLYGISDEYHQMFVPNRGFDTSDMLADAVGSFVGACVRLRRRREKGSSGHIR